MAAVSSGVWRAAVISVESVSGAKTGCHTATCKCGVTVTDAEKQQLINNDETFPTGSAGWLTLTFKATFPASATAAAHN